VFFWLKAKKKKRLAEQRRQQEEEERLRQEQQARYQEEQRRLEEEQRQLQEQTRRESETRVQDQGPRSREHTVILNPGTGTGEFRGGSGKGLSLEVLMGSEQGQIFNIGAEGATLGRAQGNSIVLNDSTVSSRHARIYWSDGQFYIEDLGSLNGVFVNGQKVTLSRVEQGSTFKLGSNEGVFRLY